MLLFSSILFFLILAPTSQAIFGLIEKKKKLIYDPFNFHQYTDFYGQYSLKRGRKVYSYCFDVRYTPKQDCQPPFSASLPINPIVPGSGMGIHGVMVFFDLFRIYLFH